MADQLQSLRAPSPAEPPAERPAPQTASCLLLPGAAGDAAQMYASLQQELDSICLSK